MCTMVYGLGLVYSNLEKSIPTLWEAVHHFCILSSLTEKEGITQSEEDIILHKQLCYCFYKYSGIRHYIVGISPTSNCSNDETKYKVQTWYSPICIFM